MNHTFQTQTILRLLLIAALFLAGGIPPAPAAAAPPQSAKASGQAKAKTDYKGPGFVLVSVDRVPVATPPNGPSLPNTDREGNVYTTRWDSNHQIGDSSITGTFKEVMTEVEKATGNSKVMRSIEREGGVSWTPPPAAVPPGFVYQPQPKFSGSAKGTGIPSVQEGGDIDLQIAAFSVEMNWPQSGPLVAQVNMAYRPDGLKTWANKPVVFPDLKAIEATNWEYVLKVYIEVLATSPAGTDARVTYNYEARRDVTAASVTTAPEGPPKPPQEPIAPKEPIAPAKPAPAPGSGPTPEVTPKTPEKPVPPTPPQKPSSTEQRFEVYDLGEGMNILQSADKPRGTLSVAGGKMKFEEAGKPVFSVGRAEIKEIDANAVLGYNTGTFHVILKSGKTYNFAPASLSIADGQKMVESIKHALP